jgi:hypothetical protein
MTDTIPADIPAEALGTAAAPPTQPTLAPWQQRVVDEHRELLDRMDKLSAFLRGSASANLAVADRKLLNRQWWAMDTYAWVLAERIAGFGVQ